MRTPIIVASGNGAKALPDGIRILKRGGSAMDAVEACSRFVEADVSDVTVGRGGLPNILGVVELDASIVDGTTHRAGAVAALVGFHHPITIARAVMTKLPHVMLVGAGAAMFASEIGAERIQNLTPSTRKLWIDALKQVGETPASVKRTKKLLPIVKRVIAKRLGTVNFIALDKKGNVASAVTTSGWGYKYPGRVGDSPIIGAGNYCDTKSGGACCTGFGELAMRNVTAKTAVDRLAQGLSAAAVARRAIADANALQNAPFNIVVLAADGTHASAANRPERRYAFMDTTMAEAATKLRTVVATRSRRTRGAGPAQ
jgi:beta-aspartyl-peptidase (threonine type)